MPGSALAGDDWPSPAISAGLICAAILWFLPLPMLILGLTVACGHFRAFSLVKSLVLPLSSLPGRSHVTAWMGPRCGQIETQAYIWTRPTRVIRELRLHDKEGTSFSPLVTPVVFLLFVD